ncbi:MAG TPA: recombination mediator RecR [bacterium]|nr:recombination mediator RecR [bacterium]HOL48026.1 recombination mediator RecR [bacterium]HPQ19142.1 recombination mediator RecR [bacterium]
MFEDINSIKNLVNNLNKLPSIGEKSALRLVLYLLSADDNYINELITNIKSLKEKVSYCEQCNCLTENEDKICNFCKNTERNQNILCIVEQPQEVIIIEKNNIFNGRYFVLKGAIDPLNNIGPDDIDIDKLISLLKKNEQIKEIIIATNPTLKGEMTAEYLESILKDYNIKITRIGYGMPVGAALDFADAITLKKSFDSRTILKEAK